MRESIGQALIMAYSLVALSACDDKPEPSPETTEQSEQACEDLDDCELVLVSEAQELEIGRSVNARIDQAFIVLSASDPVAVWATELVASLSEAAEVFRPSSGFGAFKVAVIWDDELVGAHGGPGGFTYISTGLILASTSCAETAGVVAHELAHVSARHAVESIENSYSPEMLGDAIDTVVIGFLTDYLSSLQFSQAMESEADEMGLQIAFGSDYNPYGFIEFFEKLEAPWTASVFFASSVPTQARLASAEGRIQEIAPGVVRGQTPPSYACIGTSMSLEDVQERIRAGELQRR